MNGYAWGLSSQAYTQGAALLSTMNLELEAAVNGAVCL